MATLWCQVGSPAATCYSHCGNSQLSVGILSGMGSVWQKILTSSPTYFFDPECHCCTHCRGYYFVAIATGVGWGKIWLPSARWPIPENPSWLQKILQIFLTQTKSILLLLPLLWLLFVLLLTSADVGLCSVSHDSMSARARPHVLRVSNSNGVGWSWTSAVWVLRHV